MANIYRRCKINVWDFSNINNLRAHSQIVAAVCVRVSAMAYALTQPVYAHGISWAPFSELIEEVRATGLPSATTFIGEDRGETFSVLVPGGIALGVPLGDTLVIGFRGTSDGDDWSVNLHSEAWPLPLLIPAIFETRHRRHHWPDAVMDKGPLVHCGFYRVAMALATTLDVEISRAKERRPFERVILTGHSLGGALALLAGTRIWHDAIYTFGSPRAVSKEAIADLPNVHFRYVINGDPVPHLPPAIAGFAHDGPCISLDAYRGLTKPSRLTKFLAGVKAGTGFRGRLSAGTVKMMAAEHDLGLYMEAIDRA